jgi:hypothetical protein
MATITRVTDRSVSSCSGGAGLAALEVHADIDGRDHEYRIREWAYRGLWQLQELNHGATGMVEADWTDLGEFATRDEALAHVEALS